MASVQVLTKTIPIEILADEMRRIYFRRLEYPKQIAAIKTEETKDLHAQMAVTVGEQLKRKMDISPCPLYNPRMKNKHCELTYYVTQFLTGHGCFRKYLHRFGHDSFPTCPNCIDEKEDAEHILTCCPRFR